MWKWVKKFDHQDFQILELGSPGTLPGTSWFWQLVQALWYFAHAQDYLNLHILCMFAAQMLKLGWPAHFHCQIL